MKTAIYLVPKETSNVLMKEILRVRRRAFVKDEARRCSMHWWGGLHVSLTSFADSIASERIRKVVTDWVLDHSKTRKNFRVLPDYVTTTKVRKRVDAASVVFDASYFESLLDSVEKVDENFALAVSKRRKKLGRMRSMTILATNTRSEEPGRGTSLDRFLKDVPSDSPFMSMLKYPELEHLSFRLKGKVQKVKMRRYVESAALDCAVKGFVVNTIGGDVYGEAEAITPRLDRFQKWLEGRWTPKVFTNLKPTPVGMAYPELARVDRVEFVRETIESSRLLKDQGTSCFIMIRDSEAAAEIEKSRYDRIVWKHSRGGWGQKPEKKDEDSSWKSLFASFDWELQIVTCKKEDYEARAPYRSWSIVDRFDI